MKLEKPTVSIENFTREIRSVFINPFKGVRSAVTLNRTVGITIENQNLNSNIGFLYSTSNFLSSAFVDDYKNIIVKNVLVFNDFVGKSVFVLNGFQPHTEITLQSNKLLSTILSFGFNKETSTTCSFLAKCGNSHTGIEMNLKNKYESAFFFRLEKYQSIFATVMRYDILNISLFKKLSEKIDLASETMITDKSIFSRIGMLISTHCTNMKIELNSMLRLLVCIDKKILENFVISICTEMKNFGVFETGIGINLEF